MRIGIDAHQLNGKPQGSRTYLLHLLRHLAPLTAPDESLFVYSFDPPATRRMLGVDGLEHRRLAPELPHLRIPLVVPALALRDRLSVFHAQYIAPPVSPTPLVVSVHDILFETHPELFAGALSRLSARLIRRSARRARFVLTGSAFSRAMLLELYGLPEERVVVIPDAVDPERFRPVGDAESRDGVRARYGLARPYVLSVGRLEPRKNLERLVRSFHRLHRRLGGGLDLVLAGPLDFGFDAILREAERLPEGTVRILGPVEDAELPALYSAASVFAYPSLVEGFGLPVLEAMACGAPVVCSPRGSLAEVAGDAALLVDPEDEEGIAAALELVLSDEERARDLRRRGLQRAAEFDWKETARRTLAIYRRCGPG